MTRPSARRAAAVFAALATAAALIAFLSPAPARAGDQAPSRVVVGQISDSQGQPIEGAEITALTGPDHEPIAGADSQPDGGFILVLSPILFDSLTLRVERAHFEPVEIQLQRGELESLRAEGTITLAPTTLQRKIEASFWIATGIFAAMLVVIALGRLHNTLASLVAMALVFLTSYLGPAIHEGLFIFSFERSLHFVDWNVIFLIMGMMIVIAVVEHTGIFQWLAFKSYQLSRGKSWLLLVILMTFTGVASAFLDNVTTMLLMAPITIQIALALNIHPLALIMPEIFASNVVGISTLVGTPTNILIGSYGGIGFNDFLTRLTPGVVLSLTGLILYSLYTYRSDFRKVSEISPVLLEALEDRSRITEPDNLRKAGIVGAGMLVLFIAGESLHMPPSVTALIGAAALMVWIRPDIEQMIEAVDWTTLVFFISLFVVVGAVQEVGLISFVADLIAGMVGDNLVLAMLVIIWVGALLSMVIANIPFTAAMLPVVGFLTATIPGAGNKVLFYSLSVGSAMGGNGSLIGASANMVAAGITERAGYPITYAYFFRKGTPALVVSLALSTIWLLIRF